MHTYLANFPGAPGLLTLGTLDAFQMVLRVRLLDQIYVTLCWGQRPRGTGAIV